MMMMIKSISIAKKEKGKSLKSKFQITMKAYRLNLNRQAARI